MDWVDYLRDQAAKYRQLAETAEDPPIKQELLDLAAICEEVANNIEDYARRVPRRYRLVAEGPSLSFRPLAGDPFVGGSRMSGPNRPSPRRTRRNPPATKASASL